MIYGKYHRNYLSSDLADTQPSIIHNAAYTGGGLWSVPQSPPEILHQPTIPVTILHSVPLNNDLGTVHSSPTNDHKKDTSIPGILDTNPPEPSGSMMCPSRHADAQYDGFETKVAAMVLLYSQCSLAYSGYVANATNKLYTVS